MAKEEGVYVTYKAFDKDLKCNGFQYEIGKSYHTEEDIHLIHHGFHGCVTPLGLLSYYCKHRENYRRFAIVGQYGNVSSVFYDGDTISSSDIKIIKEISLKELLDISVKWLLENETIKKVNRHFCKIDVAPYPNNSVISNGEDCQIYATSSVNSKICSSGKNTNLTSDEDFNQMIVNGADNSVAINNTDFNKLLVFGINANVACNGKNHYIHTFDSANISGNMEYSNINCDGNFAKIAIGGSYNEINVEKKFPIIASCGRCNTINNKGEKARIVSCGSGDIINSKGKESVVVNVSYEGCASAKVGSWITLAEYDRSNHFAPKCVKTEYVDGKRIKGNTLYTLVNGEFVEKK